MKITFSRAAALLAAPVLTVSAIAAEPAEQQDADQSEEQTEAAEEKSEDSAIVIPEVKEEKRICRRISTDMSSRRKERVCMTKEEWREFNQRR